MSIRFSITKLVFMSLLFFMSCNNPAKNTEDDKSQSIQERRTAYLQN